MYGEERIAYSALLHKLQIPITTNCRTTYYNHWIEISLTIYITLLEAKYENEDISIKKTKYMVLKSEYKNGQYLEIKYLAIMLPKVKIRSRI